ncbi:MAG: hypothetical protein HQL03_02935 [Nitrospirae bacterium]|nr:hypothetical protein [Nitrospirota bacterium]MBF0590856.1 hypothetical protein [Nitrospirota bacterium]
MQQSRILARSDEAWPDTANISTVEIPLSEQWLYDNKEALESVRAGLEDSKAGRITKLNLDEL